MDKDSNNQDFVAVVIDFDGSHGVIIVDRVWLTTGEGKTMNGTHLFITSDTHVAGDEQPDFYYIRQE